MYRKRLKQIISLPILMLSLVILIGCEGVTDSNIDLVQGGTMDINQSTTIGQALNNWHSCEDSAWSERVTDNGIQIVEFVCQHSVLPFMAKMKEIHTNYETGFTPDLYDIIDHKEIFQFIINVDDTFSLNAVYSNYIWSGGLYYSREQQVVQALNNVYANKDTWDMFVPNDAEGDEQKISLIANAIYMNLRTNAVQAN